MAAPEIADLGPDERDIVAVVRDWVDGSVRPVARGLEHADAYPAELIETMKQFGVYGLVIPERYGGGGGSPACFALVTEELARGWMSLAGAMGGHSVVARLITVSGSVSAMAARTWPVAIRGSQVSFCPSVPDTVIRRAATGSTA